MTVFPHKLVETILRTCEERAERGEFSLEDAVAYFAGGSDATAILDCEVCNPHPDFQAWVTRYFSVPRNHHWMGVFTRSLGGESNAVRRFCDVVRQFQGEGVASPPVDSIDPSNCPFRPEVDQRGSDTAVMAFPELDFLTYQSASKWPAMYSCAPQGSRKLCEILLQLEGKLAGCAVLAPGFAELEADFQRWVTARYGRPESTNWRILLAEELSECETRFETLSQLLTEYQEAATGERLTPDEIEELIQTKLLGRKPGAPRTLKERLEELLEQDEAERKETDG